MPPASHRISLPGRSMSSAAPALARVGALALLLVATSLIGYKLGWFDYRHMLEHLGRLRASHGIGVFTVGFVLVFGIGTAVGVPGMPLTVIAGLLFGTLLGTVLSWMGAMIGAAAGYWIARTVGRNVVSKWLKRFNRIDAAIVESCDFDGMLRLRLIPVLPIGIANFVSGLARAPFALYLVATAIGVLPATVIYAYFADSFLEGIGQGQASARISLVIASILMIVISLAPRMFGRFKNENT